MKASREINIKPSCMSDIQSFPSDQTHQLWEKIDHLVSDPLPDGKLKKKIKGQRELYRLRVGDYRLFYTFGTGWVRLLGIRKRDNDLYKDNVKGIDVDKPLAPSDAVEDDLDELQDQEEGARTFTFDPKGKATPLQRKLTPEFLESLNIAPGYFPVLVPCRTEEELMAAVVPEVILNRLLDGLFPLPIDEMVAQPDLIVQDTSDLVRYLEGDLVAFLLKLDEDQMALTSWALRGPTMVKGGAGTGKSTVALYRVKALLERPGATGKETVLFTTYTRALITASQQLLAVLLTPAQMQRVRVAGPDELAREIVASVPGRRPGMAAGSDVLASILHKVRTTYTPAATSAFDRRLRAQGLAKLSDGYLLDEFEWIIDGRNLTTLEQYQEAPRAGRTHVFRAGMREAVWGLYQAFVAEVQRQKLERFAALRCEALQTIQGGHCPTRFDFVVVDEAQDLSPVGLALLAELAWSGEGLFFASDSKQSLYSRNYTWSMAHPRLQFTGRTAHLKRNYRSTGEIDRAAYSVLSSDSSEDLEPSASIHSGPFPVLVRGVRLEAEGEWAARFIRQMCRHLRMRTSAGAVLVPSKQAGERLAGQLAAAGVPARFFAGRELDLQADVVKVLTLHSAKGLEFPVVVVAGFEPGTYAVPEKYDPETYQERLRHERRLLYVGLSRAMRGLMVLVPADCRHEALTGLEGSLWHMESAS